jgi:hypothetical protein
MRVCSGRANRHTARRWRRVPSTLTKALPPRRASATRDRLRRPDLPIASAIGERSEPVSSSSLTGFAASTRPEKRRDGSAASDRAGRSPRLRSPRSSTTHRCPAWRPRHASARGGARNLRAVRHPAATDANRTNAFASRGLSPRSGDDAVAPAADLLAESLDRSRAPSRRRRRSRCTSRRPVGRGRSLVRWCRVRRSCEPTIPATRRRGWRGLIAWRASLPRRCAADRCRGGRRAISPTWPRTFCAACPACRAWARDGCSSTSDRCVRCSRRTSSRCVPCLESDRFAAPRWDDCSGSMTAAEPLVDRPLGDLLRARPGGTWSFSLSLMCSYWRARLGARLDPARWYRGLLSGVGHGSP